MLPGKRSPCIRLLLVFGALLALGLALSACTTEPETIIETVIETVVEQVEVTRIVEQPAETVVETVIEEVEVEVEVTRIVEVEVEAPVEEIPLPDNTAILASYAASPMGNNYDLGKGPNTYCSRCHSPQNWDPASTTDRPPNCVTCKFPTDEEVRMATTMDFVAEEDWVGIACETCHLMEGKVSTGILAWLNQLTGEHEPVNSPNDLCTKCHLTSSGVSASGGTGVAHEIYLGGSAHKNWAGVLTDVHRPDLCSDCHDPHTQAPLQCDTCHAAVLTLDTHIKGTNEEHANVSCMACHDATEAEVAPHPDEEMGGEWVTVLNSIDRAGNPSSAAIVSHSPQWLVNCDRCHFAENPWELTELTAAGEEPADED